MTELSEYTITELSRLLREKNIDSVSLFEFFYDKIKNYKDQDIFISLNKERSLIEARKSAERYRNSQILGPLDGIPMAWKDLIDIKGYRTTCGSSLLKNNKISNKDAKIVENCKNQGMIVLGKVNLTEFAFSGIGINPNFGTPKNYFNFESGFIPGGSSSGSAVSVASGLSPISIGTDTGGSVRIPASMNGLVGYKTSENYIDSSSVQKLSHTLDTIGIIGKCLDDCILVERALRNEHIVVPKNADLHNLTFFVPKNYILEDASEDIVKNFNECLSIFSKKGIKIKEVYVEEFDQMYESSKTFGTIVTAESYFNLKRYLDLDFEHLIDERVRDRIDLGKSQSALDYISIKEDRARLNKKIKRLFDNESFLLMPTIATNTPKIKDLEMDKNYFHRINGMVLRNTMIGNYFNLPGVTFPNGYDSNGLPTGILMSSYSFFDEKLICYARSIEKILHNHFKF